MQRESRLRRSADFERARTKGRSWVHTIVACYVYARDDPAPARVGVIAGRRTGKAVVRNRIKRRIREAVRPLLGEIPIGHDVLLIARAGAAEATSDDVRAAVRSLLGRAGLIHESSI